MQHCPRQPQRVQDGNLTGKAQSKSKGHVQETRPQGRVNQTEGVSKACPCNLCKVHGVLLGCTDKSGQWNREMFFKAKKKFED